MQTTNELLDAVKSRYALPSDYALAGKLKVSRERVSKYRNRGDSMGDDTALRVAELLELDSGYVLACMEAERAQSDVTRKVWERAAERLAALARREAAGDCILC